MCRCSQCPIVYLPLGPYRLPSAYSRGKSRSSGRRDLWADEICKRPRPAARMRATNAPCIPLSFSPPDSLESRQIATLNGHSASFRFEFSHHSLVCSLVVVVVLPCSSFSISISTGALAIACQVCSIVVACTMLMILVMWGVMRFWRVRLPVSVKRGEQLSQPDTRFRPEALRQSLAHPNQCARGGI